MRPRLFGPMLPILLTQEQYDDLTTEAEAMDTSKAEIMRQALEAYLKRRYEVKRVLDEKN